jgi:hypothetical protein
MKVSSMGKKNQHVVPAGEGWVVREEGKTRPTSIHRTQKDAVEAAREVAKAEGTTVVIHGRDGRIRERDRYGSLHDGRKTRKVLLPTADIQTDRKRIEQAVDEVMQEWAAAT